MIFEWDENKNASNKRKHGVSFETAVLVFSDPRAVSYLDCVVDQEQRWHTIGYIDDVVILLVVHTEVESYGEEETRIISARKASRRERAIYEAHQ